MADWYYAKNGQQQGPVTSAQLKQLASSGQIGPDDLVFREGGTQWVAASTVAGLFPAGGAAATTARPPSSPGGGAAPASAPARGGRRDDDYDDDVVAPRRTSRGDGGGFADFAMFRMFITSWVLVIAYWIMTALAVLGGLIGVVVLFMYSGVGYGLALLLLLPFWLLFIRIYCELTILFFRTYDVLVEIRQGIEKQAPK